MSWPHSKYFLVGDTGIRIWFRPNYWRIGRYVDRGRVTYELGPVTVYTGW